MGSKAHLSKGERRDILLNVEFTGSLNVQQSPHESGYRGRIFTVKAKQKAVFRRQRRVNRQLDVVSGSLNTQCSLGSKRHTTWQGLFAAEPAADRSRRARVLDLTFDTFDEQQVPYREVAQSLMLLDRTGKIRVRQTGKRAHQTLVAEQSDGHLLVLKTTEVVSLHALGECLRDAFPSLRQVMAMDGGSSSDLAVSPSLQQAMSKAAGIHDWIPLLEDSITTHIGLPAVIGVSPRREQTGVKAVGK